MPAQLSRQDVALLEAFIGRNDVEDLGSGLQTPSVPTELAPQAVRISPPLPTPQGPLTDGRGARAERLVVRRISGKDKEQLDVLCQLTCAQLPHVKGAKYVGS